jgi:transcriptional regulator with XRE-family HTH domain
VILGCHINYDMFMTSAEIGLILARARREARLSQGVLAARLGTSQPAISRAESGGASPGPELIDRWAEAVGRPITLTFGVAAPRGKRANKKQVRQALNGYKFDPWKRNPSPAERRSLLRDGLTRVGPGES